LFGLGIAWAARRSVRTVLAAAAGGLAVLVPSYLWFGPPAITVLLYRDAGATSDNLYQLFSRPFGLARPPDLILLVVPLLVAVGWLLLRPLPDGAAGRPAIRPAPALSPAAGRPPGAQVAAGAAPDQCANPCRNGSGASGVCACGCAASARQWRRRSARNSSSCTTCSAVAGGMPRRGIVCRGTSWPASCT